MVSNVRGLFEDENLLAPSMSSQAPQNLNVPPSILIVLTPVKHFSIASTLLVQVRPLLHNMASLGMKVQSSLFTIYSRILQCYCTILESLVFVQTT